MKVTIKNLNTKRIRNIQISGYQSVEINPLDTVTIEEPLLATRNLYNSLGKDENDLEVKIDGVLVDPNEVVPPLPPMTLNTPLSSLKLDKSALDLVVEDTFELALTYLPKESPEGYTYNVKDEGIITLDEPTTAGITGTAIKEGSTKLEVRANKTPGVFYEVDIAVTAKPEV